MNKTQIISKIHLVVSVIIVLPVSIIYGFNLASGLNIHSETTDEFNLLKAIMGLYIGFSVLWLLGIFKTKFLNTALWSNMIFMLGLGLGRVISLRMDGTPSMAYIYGTMGELFLGFYGLWVLTRKKP